MVSIINTFIAINKNNVIVKTQPEKNDFVYFFRYTLQSNINQWERVEITYFLPFDTTLNLSELANIEEELNIKARCDACDVADFEHSLTEFDIVKYSVGNI